MDDTIGHYEGRSGDLIVGRCTHLERVAFARSRNVADRVESDAGKGTFGRVLKCYDLVKKRTVAIKAVRSMPRYIDAAKIEADILAEVNERDPDGKSLCVKFYEFFKEGKHLFLVFEPLGDSLYSYIKKVDYKGLPLYCVQEFAEQILKALAFLHDMKLIHTDLKPENLLLMTRRYKSGEFLTHMSKHTRTWVPESTGVKSTFQSSTYDHYT